MKYIISTGILLLLPLYALAGSVVISTDKNNYNIDDTIALQIQVESDNPGDAQIIVGNLQTNFSIIGQSQSAQTQVINGASQSSVFINLNLLANIAGSYTIGPIGVQFSDGENISSEPIDIEVTGERILINPQVNTPTQSTGSGSIPQDLSKIHLGNNSHTGEKEILGVNGELMQDIYDIKGNILPRFYTLWSIVIAIIGTLLLYILSKYTSRQKNTTKITKHKKQINYKKILQKIRTHDIEKNKNVFYGKVGNLFREYLDAEVEYGLSGKSLSEVKSILPKKLLEIYTLLYYPAYNNKTDTSKDRTEILDTLEQIMTKK